MKTSEPLQQYPKRAQQGMVEIDATRLSIIRTETVFSRLPIHQLSKRGRIEIRIIRRERAGGQISLYWRVSPNREFGEPRQLAYKLDTLIVNRRLDDLGRPLPRIIRVGSLHSIAEQLGLARNTDRVKQVFRQNALVGITARVSYRNRDGAEESIDATFTRYSVVFRGQALPDGRKAETVYLILNDPYLQVVNNSVVRPQDYDYLAELAPAAQRFYELASFKIFAALKNGYPQARLAYSEFCTAAPQTRYYDYEHFKKQMYKIHRPHLASGYLAAVAYERTKDAQGRGDWLLCYTPGPRARSEFRAFSPDDPEHSRSAGKHVEPLVAGPRPGRGQPTKQPGKPAQDSGLARPAVQRFHALARNVADYDPDPRGRELRQAEELLANHSPRQLDFLLDYAVRAAARTKFRMRTFGAILQYVPEAMAEYHRIEREQEARRRADHERQAREQDYEASLRLAEERLRSLDSEQYNALYELVRANLTSQYSRLVTWKGPGILEDSIKLKMAERLNSEPDAPSGAGVA